jgi:hypothetical protein
LIAVVREAVGEAGGEPVGEDVVSNVFVVVVVGGEQRGSPFEIVVMPNKACSGQSRQLSSRSGSATRIDCKARLDKDLTHNIFEVQSAAFDQDMSQ